MATAPFLTEDDILAEEAGVSEAVEPLAFLTEIAQAEGDISGLFDASRLTGIGHDVVRDYEADLGDRKDWEDKARAALRMAAQDFSPLDNAPAYRRSNIHFPILTVAAQQFNARAYPAICRSGNIVRIKVIGSDKGRPKMGPQGPVMQPAGPPDPETGQAPMAPVWDIAPGAKQSRADRVADYMNVYVEFRMKNWEEDTDKLLMQLPIVGCGFRKVWWANPSQKAAFVSALDLVVPVAARCLADAPRVTECLRDVFPFQIRERINAGEYRAIDLPRIGDDDESPRLLLEQHRLMDLDGDGVDEPYIVTVDKETSSVLRIEANYSPDEIHLTPDGAAVMRIERGRYYIKYSFLPHPKGMFYDIGFGHLLDQMQDIINTTINQMFDAGHAQIAGGGWIASGLRIQGSGQSSEMTWEPGEYKTVNVSGAALRDGIVERTFPNVSPVMFQLLDMMLGAAKDITSVKDVVTGEASNTAPVGTTLALIEQGLSVFTAIYKRVYRSLGEEFALIFDNLARYGDGETAADYLNVLDDPEADFRKDFADADMDIKPVADPTNVTKMQQVGKAQAMASLKGQGLNDLEINKFIMETIGVDDIDRFLPQPQSGPDPMMIAELQVKASAAELNSARAGKAQADTLATAMAAGHKMGESSASIA